jgi:chitodextrinase
LPAAQAQYQFVVRARDAAGNLSADTAPVTGTSGADDQAPIFRGCSGAEASGASGVRVFWKAPSDDSTEPELIKIRAYVRKASDADFNFAQPAGEFTGGTDGTVTGLDAATQYFVVCRAADAFGNEDQNEVTRSATTVNDDEPPVFGGVTGTSDVTTTGVTLAWDAGTDNRSAPEDLVYEVYQSQNPGEVDFMQPPAFTTPAGATSFAVTGLAPGTTYYFTVRATDEAGNQSTNTEERPVPLKVSFAVNVQAVFTASCALSPCHAGAQPSGALRLQEGAAYADLVNKPSVGVPAFDRVEPGSRNSSYLYKKITDSSDIVGDPMPLTGSLPPETLDLIGRWIDEGAENN